jgi:WD40 repeat protein
MCVIPGEWWPLGFADEGRRLLVTISTDAAESVDGPLRVLDARTGVEIARHLMKDQLPSHTAISHDGRFVAAEVIRWKGETKDITFNSLFILDTKTNRMRELPLDEEVFSTPYLEFSNEGELLLRVQSENPKGLRIWDTATGQLVHERPTGKEGLVRIVSGVVVNAVRTGKDPSDLEFWNLRERKSIGTLPRAGDFVGQSGNWQYVVSETTKSDGVASQPCVWNLKSLRLEKEIPIEGILKGHRTILSNDGRWMASLGKDAEGKYVELRSLPSTAAVKKTRVEGRVRIEFSPDGKFLMTALAGFPGTVTMLDVPGLNLLWQKHEPNYDDIHLCSNSRTVFLFSRETTSLQAIDTNSGKVRAQYALPPFKADWRRMPMVPTPDGRTLMVCAASDIEPVETYWLRWVQWINRRPIQRMNMLVLIDVESCQERFRLDGAALAWHWLSDNGRTLATIHAIEPAGHVICCWDIDAGKPLHWPIGIPAALGGVLVLFTWWRSRRVKAVALPASQ